MDKIKHLENKYSIARYDLIRSCEGEELRFYLYLKLYAINKHEAFPTYKTIKENLGWSKGKISKLLKKMVKLGHIKIGKGEIKTKGGKQARNIYDITWYDKLNERGFHLETKGFPFGNTLPLKGVSICRPEQVESITSRNITKEVGGQAPTPPLSPHHEIIAYFISQVKEEKGFAPEISYKKVGNLLKNLLKRYTPEQLRRLIDYYLSSKKCLDLGVDLAICLSSNTINLWLQDEGAEE